MDTIYYTLNTRRVKVSGGRDLVTVIPVAGPARAQGQKRAGEILDLALCKKQLETRQAWRELSRTALEAPCPQEDREEVPAPAPLPRREQAGHWLELGATAAVALAGLGAAVAFLSVL